MKKIIFSLIIMTTSISLFSQSDVGDTKAFWVSQYGFFQGTSLISATLKDQTSLADIWYENTRINDIEISSDNSEVLLVGTESGVVLSEDGGNSWSFKNGVSDLLPEGYRSGGGDPALQHRAPVTSIFYRSEDYWMAGCGLGHKQLGDNKIFGGFRTSNGGEDWNFVSRGSPVYNSLGQSGSNVDERPAFYEMINEPSNADDFWAATEAGLLFYDGTKWEEWSSAGLPKISPKWDHLEVFDIHYAEESQIVTIVTTLGIYQGEVDLDEEMVAWSPLNTSSITSTSTQSEWSGGLTVNFTPPGTAEPGDWYTVFSVSQSRYWLTQCEIYDGAGSLILTDDNLYAAQTFADFDYSEVAGTEFTITPAENRSFLNIEKSSAEFYVADEHNVYHLVNGSLGPSVFEIQDGTIHDLRMHNNSLYIATSRGVFLDGTVISPQIGMPSRTETYPCDIRSLASDGINLYAGGHLGGLIKSTDNGNSWTFLNMDLDHRETPMGGRENVMNLVDPTNATNLPGIVSEWFGDIDEYFTSETRNLLIFDIDDLYYSSQAMGEISKTGDFRPIDLPSLTPDSLSNNAVIVYLDNNPQDLSSELLDASTIHWMTYMIHSIVNPGEDEWLKRGLAYFSETLIDPQNIPSYSLQLRHGLTEMSAYNNAFKDNSKAFWTFIKEKFLTEAGNYQALANSGTHGIMSLMFALESAGNESTSFPELFEKFGLTMLLDSWVDNAGAPVRPDYTLEGAEIILDDSHIWWDLTGAGSFQASPYTRTAPPLSISTLITRGYATGTYWAPGLGDDLIFFTTSSDSLNVELVKSIQNDGAVIPESVSMESGTEPDWPGNFYFDISDFENEGEPDDNAIDHLSAQVSNCSEENSSIFILHYEFSDEVWMDLWHPTYRNLHLELTNYTESQFQLIWGPIFWGEAPSEGQENLPSLRDLGFEGYQVKIYQDGLLVQEISPVFNTWLDLTLDMEQSYCFDVRALFDGNESSPIVDDYCLNLETEYSNYSTLWTAVSNYGVYGDPNVPASLPSMEWPGGSNTHYLWEGRFWVGGRVDEEIRVSHADYGSYEWAHASNSSNNTFSVHTQDTLIIQTYDDYNPSIHSTAPLGFEVQQTTRSFSAGEYNQLTNCLAIDLTLTKSETIIPQNISDVYVSWVFDADVGTGRDLTSPHIDDLVDYEGYDGSDSDTDEEDIVENLDWNENGILDGYDEHGVPFGWEYLGSSLEPNPNYNPGLIAPDGFADEYQVIETDPEVYTMVDRNMSYMYDADDYDTPEDDTGENGSVLGFIGLRYMGGPTESVFTHQWWNWESDPITDLDKYLYMSAEHPASMGYKFVPNPLTLGANPFDYRWLMSIGPLDEVLPGDEIKFAAAVVLGKGIEGLRTNSDAAFLWFHENTWVNVDSQDQLPMGFQLSAPYPNPFNSTLTLAFSIERAEGTTLSIFDIRGREILQFSEENHHFSPGENLIHWTGSTADGRLTESGIYIIRLKSGGQSLTSKVVMIR